MKKQMMNSIVAFGFAALLGTSTAAVAAEPKQTASVPFVFVAAGVEYPSGHYSIQRVGSSRVVILRNVDTGRGALVNAPILAGETDYQRSKLVFLRDGERLRLSEVWFAGSPGMITQLPSKHEPSARVVVPVQ